MWRVAGALLGLSLGGCFGLTAGARADDYPTRKPGLWEIAMTSAASKMHPGTSKLCIDSTVDAALYKATLDGAGMSCSRRDMQRTGSTVTIDSVCTMGDRQVTSHIVIVFSGETANHTDITSHIEPPMAPGRADSVMAQDARWVGLCPADMLPGDVLMPNGIKINLISQRKDAR